MATKPVNGLGRWGSGGDGAGRLDHCLLGEWRRVGGAGGEGQLQGLTDTGSCPGWPNGLQWLSSTSRAPCRARLAIVQVGLVSGQKIVLRDGPHEPRALWTSRTHPTRSWDAWFFFFPF